MGASWPLALVCLVAACRREAPQQPPPPDPATKAVEVRWETGKKEARTHAWRLTLTPDGRFSYRRRKIGESTGSEKQMIAGTWQQRGMGQDWLLMPDSGREGLKPGDFAEGAWPELTWGNVRGFGSSHLSGRAYVVPELDPKTSRICNTSALAPDPRGSEPR